MAVYYNKNKQIQLSKLLLAKEKLSDRGSHFYDDIVSNLENLKLRALSQVYSDKVQSLASEALSIRIEIPAGLDFLFINQEVGYLVIISGPRAKLSLYIDKRYECILEGEEGANGVFIVRCQ